LLPFTKVKLVVSAPGNIERMYNQFVPFADGDFQDVSRNGQNGFRGRGRFYRGGPRGGRFNNNRGKE